jgi:hypothetical protein
MTMRNKRARRWLLSLLAGVGLTWAGPSPQAQAQARPPVPQHWISYAGMVGQQLAQWLSDPQDASVRQLHAHLQDRVLAEGQPPLPPLVARVWVDPAGKVSRLELASTGDIRIDQELRRLLMSQVLPEPPPPDMQQPMLLQLSLDMEQVSGAS